MPVSPNAAPNDDHSGLGMSVPVDGVERALKELWDNDAASTKATLINLVIFSTRAGSLAGNNALVAGLTRDHACRVLLVEDTLGAPVQAWITAHCHLSGGKKSVCSEQIAFQLDRERPGLARNTLLAHLLSDLPVILWWQGPLDDAFEPALYQHVDRLLIDSSDWPDALVAEQIETLLGARKAMVQPFSIHDLAWTRTYQFRIAVAALFDHPHAKRLHHGIETAEVVAAPGSGASAALLAAWIAHSLGWKPSANSPDGWDFVTSSGRTIRFFRREEAGAAPLARLRLAGKDTAIEVTRACGDHHVEARIVDEGNMPPLVLPADSDDPGDLVASMLSRGGKNSLYSAVLPAFLAMVKA